MSLTDRYSAWNERYKLGEFAPQPKRKQPPPVYSGPPKLPDTRGLMRKIQTMGPPVRSEDDWNKLLDARVKPFESTLDQTYRTQMGISEGRFERQKLANESLSAVFMREITGGLSGEEAAQFAKSRFGTSSLPAQLAYLGVQQLNKLTAEWDERDWEISGRYMEEMQKIPQVREAIRERITAEDASQYERDWAKATAILGELYEGYDRRAKAWNDGRDQARADEATRIDRGRLMLAQAETAQDYAMAMTDITGYLHTPNPKNPSRPIRTKVVAPGSKAATVATEAAADAAGATADAAADARENRRDAVKAREDDFAETRGYIFRDVEGMRRVPTLDELPIRDQRSVKRGEKKLEDFATLPKFNEAYQQLWDQYGEGLMRYSSARGKATLRKRIDTMIRKALASEGIVPQKTTERQGD